MAYYECGDCGATEDPITHMFDHRGRVIDCGGAIYKKSNKWWCAECDEQMVFFKCAECGEGTENYEIIF